MSTESTLMTMNKKQLVSVVLELEQLLDNYEKGNVVEEKTTTLTYHPIEELPDKNIDYILAYKVGNGEIRYVIKTFADIQPKSKQNWHWNSIWGELVGWLEIPNYNGGE